MGLFFEDTKPPEPQQIIVKQPQWWPVALFIFVVMLVVTPLRWICKPAFTYLGTFEGRTPAQQKMQVMIIVALVAIPLYFIYQIPRVRDFISLSKTHTINHTSQGSRIAFPDPSYFELSSVRKGEAFGSKGYFTYAGYTEGTFQKIEKYDCQLVPRGEKIRLGSTAPPANAEGFKDEVHYHAVQAIGTLTGFRYAWEWLQHPSLWFDIQSLNTTRVEIEKESTWKKFITEWDLIRKDEGDYKSFEVRALAREHAIICF